MPNSLVVTEEIAIIAGIALGFLGWYAEKEIKDYFGLGPQWYNPSGR